MIIDYIPKGKENAISIDELENITRLSKRIIRAAIKRECLENKVLAIGLSGIGYFKPATIEEADEYIRTEKSRARKIEENIRLAEKVRADMERGVYGRV